MTFIQFFQVQPSVIELHALGEESCLKEGRSQTPHANPLYYHYIWNVPLPTRNCGRSSLVFLFMIISISSLWARDFNESRTWMKTLRRHKRRSFRCSQAQRTDPEASSKRIDICWSSPRAWSVHADASMPLGHLLIFSTCQVSFNTIWSKVCLVMNMQQSQCVEQLLSFQGSQRWWGDWGQRRDGCW